ncbi:ankyrin-1-like [Achroia grisella]|uniref:ankyrin-1-like n=1 Tax=Achroia grisella TaxID=688607 RepID=UPI0027D2DC96|nr:ankyrin-1-like [Achroia grisella]
MDFSSHNPRTSNSLNLAARNNDIEVVRTLLKKMNPNCTDNRGWTCLHEAANKDSYDSLLLILKHPDCRPLAETHEGHTPLYLACRRQCSLLTIKALLDSANDIVNYGSTEGVTPLHIASGQGRVELIQLLLEYGASINVQDFDGDTPLHDAALAAQHEAVTILLHAGADPEIKNGPSLLTAFHLACCKGSFETVQNILPFMTEVNELAAAGESPLMSAVKGCNDDVIRFLLENGADPHIRNVYNQSALDMALNFGYISIFKMLLVVTDKQQINSNIIVNACKPHYFKFEILEALLNYDLGPDFFDFIEPFHVTLEEIGDHKPFYLTNAPLNSYLNICEYIYNQSPDKFREFFYLFLMRGVGVNAFNIGECPPLVYIHYCIHAGCFVEVFQILVENGLDVDYCSSTTTVAKSLCVPDAFLASLSSDLDTASYMIPYSLNVDPETFLQFACDNGVAGRISLQAQKKLVSLIDDNNEMVYVEQLPYLVPPLRHLCRIKIRSVFRNRRDIKSTKEFHNNLNHLPLPPALKKYLTYM